VHQQIRGIRRFSRRPGIAPLAGLALLGLLASCGGGGSSGGSNSGLPLSSSVAAKCASPRNASIIDPASGQPYPDQPGSLADEKTWVRSWIDETYLWYRDVEALSAATLDPNAYATPIDYFDALKTPLTTASGKPKDQFHFIYDTATWVALSQSGVSYGYGFQIALLARTPPRKALVAYTDPNTEATANAIARGAEILTVDGVDLVNDDSQAGVNTINAGLFPDSAGAHSFTIRDAGSATTRSVTLDAGTVTETPVQDVQTLPPPNQNVGYLLFNDHIATAEQELIDAVNQLKSSGITDLVLDIRYNGGGYLDLASELAYMIAGPGPTNGKAFEVQTFNDKNPFHRSLAEETTPFHSQTQGFSTTAGQALPYLGLGRVFVLSSADTCSASEAVVNGLRGVGVSVNLIGGTTCGKPYGFYPQDNCSTTYFAIQFSGVNAQGFGDYADGFAPACTVADDFSHALGDPAEGLLATALDYRASASCAAAAAKSLAAQNAGPSLIRTPLRENRIYRSR